MRHSALPPVHVLTLMGVLVAAVLLGACQSGGQTTSPTAAPTTAPTAKTAASPAAAPAARPSPAPAPAAATGPYAASSPVAKPAASPAAAGGVRLTIAPQSSEARFRAQEQLTGRPLPNEAVGSTRDVTGQISLGPSGAIAPEQSKVTVDLRTLKSDQDRRDNFIKRNTLETDQFPTAELRPEEVRGLQGPLPTSGQATFQLLGDLTVHGVTRPTTWEVEARFGEQELTGQAMTRLKISDFGMEPPRAGPVLSLEDELTLEIDFTVNRAPATADAGAVPVALIDQYR